MRYRHERWHIAPFALASKTRYYNAVPADTDLSVANSVVLNGMGQPVILRPGRNGGQLRTGNPGNSGRPAPEVRQRALNAFDRHALPELRRLASSAVKEKDRIAAANVLAKAGFSPSDAVSLEDHPEWQSRIGALRAALVEVCGEELAGQVITRAMELSV